MKYKNFICIIVSLFFISIFAPLAAVADNNETETKHLNIATNASRPLSVDKLLYEAIKGINYKAAFTATNIQEGYASANMGKTDGVISNLPYLEEEYPNLRRVPVLLGRANMYALIRADNEMEINYWGDFAGLNVGIVANQHIFERLPHSANVTVRETNKTVLDELVAGEYDVAILSERTHETISERKDVKRAGHVGSFVEYLYLHKKHEDIIPALASKLNEMFADGRADKIFSDIALPDENSKKTILHIISSNMEIKREEQFITTLRDEFKDDNSLEWYTITFNVNRFADLSRLPHFAQLLRKDCVERNIAAVVVSGDEALDFIKEYYYLFFRNTPVLFYRIDENYAKKLHGYERYFTGIAEHLSADETVTAALDIFPGIKNIYVINDYTTQGKNYKVAIENQLKTFKSRINIEYNEDLPLDDMVASLRNLPPQSVVLVGSYFRDANGQYYPQNEMKRVLENNCSVPIMTLYSTNLGYNAIGGKAMDYQEYAHIIADMLRQIFNDIPASSIPVVNSAEYNRWVFNKNLMEKFNVREGSLPKGSQVINKLPSIWESDPKFAFALVALLIMGVGGSVGLSIFLSKYKQQREHLRLTEELLLKDNKIKEVKEQLESIINSAPVAYMLTIDGVITEANEYLKKHWGAKIGGSAKECYTVPAQRDYLVERAAQQKVVENEIVKYNMTNGKSHRFLTNVTTVEYEQHIAHVLWGMDIEESEKQKDDLRASQQKITEVNNRLESIINTAPVLFSICVDGIIVEANENMKKNLGIDIGVHYRDVCVNPGDRDILAERVIHEKVLRNETLKLKFADGKINRCFINAAIIDYEGKKATAIWAVDIEQVETQKDQLSAAQQSLQTIMDTMPVAFGILDVETRKVVYANNACLKLFEYDTFEDFYKIDGVNVFAATQKDGTSAKMLLEQQLIDTLQLVTKEVQILTANGKITDTRIYTAPISHMGKKSVIGIFTDLSAEKEYKSMQESLQTILDTMPVPIRIIDVGDDTLLYANQAAFELFKVESAADVYGKPVNRFILQAQPDRTNTIELAKQLNASSEPLSAQVTCVKSTGEQFLASVIARIIDYKGKKSSLGILTDLTAEKEYERMLVSTAEKEKEANQLKSRFLVNMSHEIRTPMNAIIGLSEIELRKELPPETKEVYKKISSSAHNLLNIINDILDLSKIEADKVELFEEEFELEEVISSALLVASPRLDGKNVEFMLNASLDLPRYIIGDRTRLWQILKNYLDNSAKYTEYGKIVLTILADNEKSDENTVYLSFVIEDTGIGIPEEQIQKLFMPYIQLYNEAQKKYTGTGLGMVISKQLCELMGGKMQIGSRLGEGTIIHLSIPFRRSKNSETELAVVKSPALTDVDILAVDDDSRSLSIMSALLSGGNAKCEFAHSGEEAMSIIFERRDTGKKMFDIILLDYMMDGLTGLETAKQIQTSLAKAPKLLMVTAYQRLLLKNDLEQNGIDDVIEKPFIPSQFINKICMALGHSETAVEKPPETFTRFKDVNVLLCEDYSLNYEVAAEMFAQFGITTTIAINGKQGVEILQSGQKTDIIFMDLQMPVMDGYEATRLIRADKRFDNIPIISLTADAMKEVEVKCKEAGMDDFVTKPIGFSSLHKIFLKWLPENKRISENVIALDAQNTAIARFGGKKELYEKALRSFAQDLPEQWPGFDNAVENMEATKRYIHKIKGAAGNLSENDIYRYAAEFETSLRKDKPDKGLYARLINASNIFKKKVAEQFKTETVVRAETGTSEEFRDNLNKLKEALKSYDLKKSSTVMDALKEKTWPVTDANKLQKLYELMQNYDYIAALDVLESLKE